VNWLEQLTPAQAARVVFLDVDAQRRAGSRVAALLPFNTYARKNLGYLYAIAHGAEVIYETDDDNRLLNEAGGIADFALDDHVADDGTDALMPVYVRREHDSSDEDATAHHGADGGYAHRARRRKRSKHDDDEDEEDEAADVAEADVAEADDEDVPGVEVSEGHYHDAAVGFGVDARADTPVPALNVYEHFGQPTMWPRGLPLDAIARSLDDVAVLRRARVRPVIEQRLANGDPDVDAIFRLTRRPRHSDIRIHFDAEAPTVALAPPLLCPYNSQNTLYRADAFFTLLLPVTVAFRVTDIW